MATVVPRYTYSRVSIPFRTIVVKSRVPDVEFLAQPSRANASSQIDSFCYSESSPFELSYLTRVFPTLPIGQVAYAA